MLHEEALTRLLINKVEPSYELYVFDSMDAWNHFCNPDLFKSEKDCKNPVNYSGIKEVASKEDPSWTFGDDKNLENYMRRLSEWEPYKEVTKAIEHGFDDFISDPKIQDAFKRLVFYRRTKKFTIDDGELVLERVMSGDPEYYQKNIKHPNKKGVRVIFNFALNCGAGTTDFIQSALEMVKVAYLFDLMGVPMQIIAAQVAYKCTSEKQYSGTGFLLKHESEILNINKVGLLACSGMLRWQGFVSEDLLYSGKVSSGRGQSIEIPKEYCSFAEADFIISKNNPASKVLDELLKIVEK